MILKWQSSPKFTKDEVLKSIMQNFFISNNNFNKDPKFYLKVACIIDS